MDLDGEVVEVDGDKLEWIRDGGEKGGETGDELSGETASAELTENGELELVNDDDEKVIGKPRKAKKPAGTTRMRQRVQSRREIKKGETHAEEEHAELSEDVENDAAGATIKQQEDYPGEALAIGIGGIGLLLLCISPFFSWATFGNEGSIGLDGDGKIVLAVSVIALGVFVAATVKENWFTPLVLVIQSWGTLAAFWMGAIIWKIHSAVADLGPNPFAMMIARQISPGAGLYVGLIGSMVIVSALGFVIVRRLLGSSLQPFYATQSISLILGALLTIYVTSSRPPFDDRTHKSMPDLAKTTPVTSSLPPQPAREDKTAKNLAELRTKLVAAEQAAEQKRQQAIQARTEALQAVEGVGQAQREYDVARRRSDRLSSRGASRSGSADALERVDAARDVTDTSNRLSQYEQTAAALKQKAEQAEAEAQQAMHLVTEVRAAVRQIELNGTTSNFGGPSIPPPPPSSPGPGVAPSAKHVPKAQ